MTCSDILEFEEFESLKLIAGKNGIDRNIRWLYFADTKINIQNTTLLGNWVSGGELFVCTNENVLSDKDYILSLIKSAKKLDAAGIILNVGSIEPEYLELCDELNFPLFEIPWSIRLVDLSQILCTALIKEQSENSSNERILNTLLFSNFDSEEKIILECKNHKFDIKQPCQITSFQLKMSKNVENSDEKKKNFLNSLFKKKIKLLFKAYSSEKILTTQQSDLFTVLFPSTHFSKETLTKMLDEFSLEWTSAHPETAVSIGVGSTYNSIQNFRKSYNESEKALQLVDIISKDKKYLFFEDAGFYSILFGVENLHEFKKFVENVLGALIKYDSLNKTALCKTLEVYLENNKNMTYTSEALFIHRNTLRYRLDKISDLLQGDFDSLDNAINYTIAFKINKYLELTATK